MNQPDVLVRNICAYAQKQAARSVLPRQRVRGRRQSLAYIVSWGWFLTTLSLQHPTPQKSWMVGRNIVVEVS